MRIIIIITASIVLSLGGCALIGDYAKPVPPIQCSSPLTLTDDPQAVEAFVTETEKRISTQHDVKTPRKLAVFMDGTGNTDLSKTNIWQMYRLAVQNACNGEPVLPYYMKGVGTSWYSKIVGGAFGDGLSDNIKQGYRFLSRHYRPGDQIFVFGFSRGAYSARSLNGFIDFANLADYQKVGADNIDAFIDQVFDVYHQSNDGKPQFKQRLRAQFERFQDMMHQPRVEVEAIGVFDTVAALGLERDDFPDNHRTNLYAKQGYHAMSLDEQRHDFKVLRFDDYNLNDRILKEVWFAGAHANVGGGYCDEKDPVDRISCPTDTRLSLGLESIPRNWMLQQFEKYQLFATKDTQAFCTDLAKCSAQKLHDEFLDSKLFNEFGISRRRPRPNDEVHVSVSCRMAIEKLPYPHIRETFVENGETKYHYRPQNLSQPLAQHYGLAQQDQMHCDKATQVAAKGVDSENLDQ